MLLKSQPTTFDNISADRKVAQLSAQSGEYVYANVKVAMQHLDQAPTEIQKNLLRALIENIIIYEEKIEMNLFIRPETLPEALKLPDKEETPAPTNKGQDEGFLHQNDPTVAPKAGGSYWRPLWGPKLGGKTNLFVDRGNAVLKNPDQPNFLTI